MHLKRWITGLIALPFLIFLVYRGGIPFLLLVGFAGICSLWEYFRILIDAHRDALTKVLVAEAYLVGLAIITTAHVAGLNPVSILIALNLVFVGLLSVFMFKSNPSVVELVQKQIQGIIYIPLSLSFLVLIRREPQGMIWLFYILGIIFAGDISAYYVGSYLGRHKLNPAVSPGKTVEGALGGLVGNFLLAGIGKLLFLPALSWQGCVVFAIALGLAGQIGDLFESELKRASRIKDSGGILPGHGGFLDRIDALLFASPVAYLIKMYIL